MRRRLPTAAVTPQPAGGTPVGPGASRRAPVPPTPPTGAPPARRPAKKAMGPGHYRFRHVARMEWIKLRSLRSTWWTLGITVCGAAAMAVAIGINTRNAGGDLTNNALAGIVPGLLLTGVLGTVMMTSEYTSGMIRATLAAAPRRGLVLAAKAGVFGVVALAAGEAAGFISFVAGGAALGHGIAAPALTQPGVLRAVLLAGASFSLVGLLGLGLGTIVRHTAAAIAVLVGGVYLAAQVVGVMAPGAAGYMPVLIIGNSLTSTRPESCSPRAALCPPFLSAWAGLGMLCLYAAALLGIGGWLLARRDA
jgi:ABC-2 type transport system permease protein